MRVRFKIVVLVESNSLLKFYFKNRDFLIQTAYWSKDLSFNILLDIAILNLKDAKQEYLKVKQDYQSSRDKYLQANAEKVVKLKCL